MIERESSEHRAKRLEKQREYYRNIFNFNNANF